MNEDNIDTKDNKLEFNTYCIFTEDKQDIKDTIGLVFKDYLESLKIKKFKIARKIFRFRLLLIVEEKILKLPIKFLNFNCC